MCFANAYDAAWRLHGHGVDLCTQDMRSLHVQFWTRSFTSSWVSNRRFCAPPFQWWSWCGAFWWEVRGCVCRWSTGDPPRPEQSIILLWHCADSFLFIYYFWGRTLSFRSLSRRCTNSFGGCVSMVGLVDLSWDRNRLCKTPVVLQCTSNLLSVLLELPFVPLLLQQSVAGRRDRAVPASH